MRIHYKKTYLFLFLVYFTIELVYGFWLGNFGKNLSLKGDSLFYQTAGWNISQGLGYTFDGKTPNATYQVGYPLFLALLFKIFGNNIHLIFIAQYIMGALSLVLFYSIIGEITQQKLLKLFAVFLYLSHQIIFFLNSYIISEPLAVFLFLIFILNAIKFIKQPKKNYLIYSAFSLGYLILVRNVFLLLPVVLLILSFFRKKIFLKECLLLFLVSFVIVAPYATRNKILFNSYRLSFNASKNVLEGMKLSTERKPTPVLQESPKSLAARDNEDFKFWLKHASRHPLKTMKNYARNFIDLIFSANIADKQHHYSALRVFLIFKNILVIIGIIFYGIRRKTFLNYFGRTDYILIISIFIYYTGIFSFSVGSDGRFGIFPQILLYLILIFVLDQYRKNEPSGKKIE